jgi:hypothetical protein
MEDDQLLAAPQREQCEHGSTAESDGRQSTFEPGARSQRLVRERSSHFAALPGLTVDDFVTDRDPISVAVVGT